MVLIVAAVAGAVYYRYSQRDKSPRLSIKKKPVISDTSIKFPIILNCLQCSSRVRVARPGSFRCPSCKSVSDVDANGEMKITETSKDLDEAKEERTSAAIPNNEEPKANSNSRLSRMEQFLTGNNEEEPEEKDEMSNLSASEKLRLLKDESDTNEASNQVINEINEDAKEEPSDDEKPKRSKKRKDPPKGGSFGPTVGGF